MSIPTTIRSPCSKLVSPAHACQGADRQPVVRGFDPLIADEAPEGRLRQSLALLAELLGGDPACGVVAANEVE